MGGKYCTYSISLDTVGTVIQHTMASKKKPRESSPEREHLGWRASSAVPAKKHKPIEGVSGKGVVELQAQLYRTQEHARLRAEGLVDVKDKHVRRKAGVDVASIKNPGVEAREARDKQLQLKITGSGSERLAESSAALQHKALLYERLARGEEDDDHEKYEVEFWRKGPSHQQEEQEQEWLQHGRQQQEPVDTSAAAVAGSGGMMTEDMARWAGRTTAAARLTPQHNITCGGGMAEAIQCLQAACLAFV
eukprot:GHRQ01015295.1.p1 GENE.GHRQ01015295.1~~GHRQ01015295.1.p1  ORF type:complete len:249 (+),score=73.58 GHRQ01015295.1:275-1021(+)